MVFFERVRVSLAKEIVDMDTGDEKMTSEGLQWYGGFAVKSTGGFMVNFIISLKFRVTQNLYLRMDFYPTALKGCQGIVYTHGGREKVCPGCISESVRCRKFILGRDIG